MDVRYVKAEARLEVSDIDSELVVLNLDNGCYYAIEGVGAGACVEHIVTTQAKNQKQSH